MNATSTAPAPEVTFEVQYSWEATTLDYLSPQWYALEGESFATEAEAEARVAAKYAERAAQGSEPIAYRVRRVVAPRPEQGYSDPFLEAEFAANRQYWADQARAAEARLANEQAIRDLKGQTVEVVKGRKVPKGTRGVVFWVGEAQYGYSKSFRVGFKTAEGETHWTAASNVEKVES